MTSFLFFLCYNFKFIINFLSFCQIIPSHSVRLNIMSFIIIMVLLIKGAVLGVGQKIEVGVLRHSDQELINEKNILHRELAASATSTPATITTSDTITVTATDTDGAGQFYEISFNNECTVSAPGLTCTAVGGQEQVLDSSSTSSMTDNGDGTYTSTISVTRPGKITINVFKYTQGGVLVEYYSGTTYSGGVQHAEIKSDLNIDYGSGNLFGSTSNFASAKMYFKLKGPSTESITLQLEADDTASLSLDGSNVVSASSGTNTNTFSSTLNTMYDGQINFVEILFSAKVILSWSYTSVPMTTVPSANLYYKAYISSPMQLTINCPDGYSKTTSAGRPICDIICGDGKRAGTEECDDGNTLAAVDGCSSTCTIDSGWECHNGNPTTQDTCTQCPAGFYPNSAKNACETHCGDGKRAGSEACDDNNVRNGDGCTGTCTIESNWICNGGTTSSSDSCTFCEPGYTANNVPATQVCVSTCGDKMQVGSEKCDDGNTNGSDGCAADCSAVESGWVCANSTFSSGDVCTQCTSGFYQNDATYPTACVPQCGDSKRAGSEKCDNGDASGATGCSSDCLSITAGWVCSGGTTTTADTCAQCTAGFYQNDATNPTTCVPQCGDGLEAGTEKCDDGNTVAGDGCAADCTTVEAGWVCSGGSTTSKDECYKCADGYTQNNAVNPTTCVTTCGDGFEAGTEKCDDGNISGSDGCAADCSTVEAGWVCIGGSPTSSDTCTQCTAGFYQNDATNPETCVTTCGDGLEAGAEKCDDGNTIANDGCAADCTSVDAGWVCSGGSTTSQDTCTKCPDGFYQNNPTNPEVCVTLCGDGFDAGTEKCDDGNTISGDGCAADCTTVESGWVCKYGTPTTADVCEQCTAGYVQNDSSNPEYCVPSCGDGLRVGNELCDDANTSSNDGCSSDCSKIESGYICTGGSTGSKDTCTKCPLSYSPNEEQRKCEINPISTRAKQISYFYAIVSGVGLLLNIFMILKYNHSYISIFRTIFHIQMLYLLPLLGDKMGNDGVGFLRNFKFILATFKELPNDWVFFGWRSMFSSLDYSQENSYLPLIGIKSGSAIVNCYNLFWVSSVLSLLTGVSFLLFWKPKYPNFAKKMLKVLFRLAIRIIMLTYIFIAICAFSEVRDYKRVSKGFLSYLISITFSGVLIFTVALCAYFCLRKIPAEEQVDTSSTIEYFVGVRKDKLARFYIILWFIRRTTFVGVIFMLDYLNNALILTILVLIQLLYILALLQTRAFTTKKDNILEVFNEICYLLLIPASLYYGPSLKMVDHSMIYLFINIAQAIIEFIVCLSEITIRLKKKMKVIKPDETIEIKRKTLATQSMTSDRIIHSKNIYDRDSENVGINNYATQENPPSGNSQNMSSTNSQNSHNIFANNSQKKLHTIQEVEEIPDKSEIQVPDVSDPKIYEEFKKNWGFGQYKSQKDKFSNFS
ncbi:unnamed protein product [Moneuplotes crassus]|uniref:PA14 domain-containing protein n=1 Tax=Euplotes crassus TaxID=5936 RepID=A0AAD1U2F4_EUPCR|nr:unnamed protein product [Moneuplotes crassus]